MARTWTTYVSQEEEKKEEQRTTFDKFKKDVEKQDAISHFMSLLDQFRSVVYCQTAPAKHWSMPEVANEIAEDIREQARTAKIATLDATQFWTSIKPFMGPEQLPRIAGVKSENADLTKPDEDVINWHHYEIGETYALPYHWDRYIFRLVCYMETSLIHESVKQRNFDMTKIETL